MGVREGRRILVVDDEEDLRLMMRDLLENSGYDVEVAADGQGCIDHIAAAPPDLVLLDLMMPRLSGWSVLDWLRGQQSPPPVIVLSGMGDPFTLARTLSAGAAAAFAKPFKFAEVLSACDALTEPQLAESLVGAGAR